MYIYPLKIKNIVLYCIVLEKAHMAHMEMCGKAVNSK